MLMKAMAMKDGRVELQVAAAAYQAPSIPPSLHPSPGTVHQVRRGDVLDGQLSEMALLLSAADARVEDLLAHQRQKDEMIHALEAEIEVYIYIYVCMYVYICNPGHRVSRPRGTVSVGDSVGEGQCAYTSWNMGCKRNSKGQRVAVVCSWLQ